MPQNGRASDKCEYWDAAIATGKPFESADYLLTVFYLKRSYKFACIKAKLYQR
jgi:hypothetical protein